MSNRTKNGQFSKVELLIFSTKSNIQALMGNLGCKNTEKVFTIFVAL